MLAASLTGVEASRRRKSIAAWRMDAAKRAAGGAVNATVSTSSSASTTHSVVPAEGSDTSGGGGVGRGTAVRDSTGGSGEAGGSSASGSHGKEGGGGAHGKEGGGGGSTGAKKAAAVAAANATAPMRSKMAGSDASTRLEELALFYCVRAEAANLRFMPELLCWVFHQMLRGYRPPPSAEVLQNDTDGESSVFHRTTIIPIYNTLKKAA